MTDKPVLRWPEVFHQHLGFVTAMVGRLGGPDLETDDLVHEVFLVVHRKVGTLRDASRLRAWLYGICRRVVARERRKTRVRAALRQLWAPPPRRPDPTPEAATYGREIERRLYAALGKLPERQRETLILFAFEELSGKEIANLLSIPEATVWTRLHAARRELLRLLQVPGGDTTNLRELLPWNS